MQDGTARSAANCVSIINPKNLGQVDEEFEYTTIDELAAVVSSEAWAPGTFSEHKRTIKNLSTIDLLVLDIDDGCSLVDAAEKFEDFRHIIATSRSHQKEKNGLTCDRFRVVLFLDSSINEDKDFKATWETARKRWGFIDQACKDSSRFFYASPEIVSINRQGRSYPVSTYAEPLPVPAKETARSASDSGRKEESSASEAEGLPKGELWKSTLKFLLEGAPAGTRHNELVKAVGNMREQGYEPHEVIEKLQNMIDIGGDWTSRVTKTDLKTIERMYNREMKYGRVAPETEKIGPALIANKNGQIIQASELLDETFAYLSDKDKVKGEPTGIEGLDRLLGGGFRTGELTVLMAQAKTGKNTLYHYLIYKHLERGLPFGYASRELNPATEVIPNLLSIALGVNSWTADMSDSFKARARETLSNWSLYFSPGYGSFPAADIEAWFRASRDEGITHFLFDHFHYALEGEDYEATARLIKKLKSLTKELDIHLSLIVQPRSLREGEQLSLATLRGGAAIGQALDNLLILERVKHQAGVSKLTLEVARHKLARLGEIYLLYDTETTSFTEADRKLVHLEEETPVPRGVSKYNGRPWPRVGQDS